MIEGKLANQAPANDKMSGVLCSKCRKLIDHPIMDSFHTAITKRVEPYELEVNGTIQTFTLKRARYEYFLFSYIGTDYYIYESKSGFASTYCSKYCRDKHNHRFNKRN